MFEIHDFIHPGDLVCTEAPTEALDHRDFEWFDHNGFQLNGAEQAYYAAEGYHLDSNFRNHKMWATNWLMRNSNPLWDKFVLNHCYSAYRCCYRGKAYDHIMGYADQMPSARQLLNIRPKWGLNLSLSALAPGYQIYEILNIRYDTYIYREFNEVRKRLEEQLLNIDWVKEAEYIWNQKDTWKLMSGTDENNWKANHLLGWETARRTLKTWHR